MRTLGTILIALFGISANSFELKSGDVIVQSIKCKLCALIEAEEGLPYSHTGLVLAYPNGKVTVLEALGSVRQVSLEDFLSRKSEGTKAKVLRPRDTIASRGVPAGELIHIYQTRLAGLRYDADFLWNNQDERGQKLYCSELVVKVLNLFLREKIPTKPMHFNYDRAQWLEYFHGNPPDDQPGVSPSDLARSPVFNLVGELN